MASGESGRSALSTAGIGPGLSAMVAVLLAAAACGVAKERPLSGGSGGSSAPQGDAGTGGGAGGSGAGGSGAGGSAGVDASGSSAGDGSADGRPPTGFSPFPTCTRTIISGDTCSVSDPPCSNIGCAACSADYWHRVSLDMCLCHPDGRWDCSPLGPTTIIGDCFFEAPLDCVLASSLYTEAECTTHPPCEGGP
jgi:hypothetical protein